MAKWYFKAINLSKKIRFTHSQSTHYQLLGPSGGPLAICVHGLSTPSFVFEALAAFLIGRGYRVLLYDHYGRGYSDRPKGRQDARFFASHLTELLDHLDLNERFDLYGYSMGGSIAAAYAAQNPSSVKQLIPERVQRILMYKVLLVYYLNKLAQGGTLKKACMAFFIFHSRFETK